MPDFAKDVRPEALYFDAGCYSPPQMEPAPVAPSSPLTPAEALVANGDEPTGGIMAEEVRRRAGATPLNPLAGTETPLPAMDELEGPNGLSRMHEWTSTETARRLALGLNVVTGEPK